ncbi:hypothetical protein Hdeb2414_s0011g00359991 [Helianthus debilis subsp. tardiflorus]
MISNFPPIFNTLLPDYIWVELGSSDIHIGCDLDLGLCLLTVLPYLNIHCEEKRHFLEAMMMMNFLLSE